MSIENRAFSPEDKKMISEFISSAVRLLQEADDCKEGIKDAAKNLAEKLDIKPALLTKAANFAYKSSLDNKKEELDDVEELLVVSGSR